jgi:hypothetical protein
MKKFNYICKLLKRVFLAIKVRNLAQKEEYLISMVVNLS